MVGNETFAEIEVNFWKFLFFIDKYVVPKPTAKDPTVEYFKASPIANAYTLSFGYCYYYYYCCCCQHKFIYLFIIIIIVIIIIIIVSNLSQS